MNVRGIGNTDQNIGSFKSWWNNTVKNVVVWNETKAAPVADKAVATLYKFAKVQTLWSQRLAFLGLVKMNFRGFATRLSRKPEAENKQFWENLGGDWSNLRDAIFYGKDSPYVFGVKKGEGARDETDEQFVKNVIKNYEEVTGEAFNEIIYDTTAGPQPGYTTATIQGSIGYTEAAIAGYVAAAATIIALVVPYLGADADVELQTKITDGTATTEDYEKSWRLKATAANLAAYQKAKAEGKTEAEAALAAMKAYADTMQTFRNQYNIQQTQEALAADQKAATDALVTAKAQPAPSAVGFNILQSITDNPIPVALVTAFLFRKQLAKIFK